MIFKRFCFILAACLGASGCAHPMTQSSEDSLHEQLVSTLATQQAGLANTQAIHLSVPDRRPDKLSPKRRQALDRISGPNAYDQAHPDYGPDLVGENHATVVQMSLQQAIHRAVRHNLTLQLARLVPAVDQTQVTQAEAAFDAVFFANIDWRKLDTAQPPVATTFGSTLAPNQSLTTTVSTGLRKPLTTGGQVTLQEDVTRNSRSASLFATNTYYTSALLLTIDQPLLRQFGSSINRSQIELAANARRKNVEDLRKQLIEICQNTETAYWNLSFARHRLLIQQRLLQRTIKDRDQIEKRAVLDAAPSVITEANSFVQSRRAEVIRAQNAVRNASDTLKRLMNDKQFPVSDETLIVPLDEPIDASIEFSLLDAITTAMKHRPELRQAMVAIDDASIQQRVADNLRLPQLNLTASIQYNGLGNHIDSALSQSGEGHLIDYLLGGQFEMPIGNRAAEALYHQRRIERRASVINYQNIAQQVALEIKTALRDLITNYRVIDAERASRRAAAENLRSLEAQEEAGSALTPEFLDLKLRRQEALANAELRELKAIVNYNIAISAYYQAMGTLLTRNGIDFAEDSSPGS